MIHKDEGFENWKTFKIIEAALDFPHFEEIISEGGFVYINEYSISMVK